VNLLHLLELHVKGQTSCHPTPVTQIICFELFEGPPRGGSRVKMGPRDIVDT